MTNPAACPHCNTIGALAASVQDALHEVRAGVAQLTDAARPKPPRRRAPAGPNPTDLELACLRLAADGHTDAATAELLGQTEDTVKSHLSRLYRRLGARNRAHAVHLAHRAGYLNNNGGGGR